MQRATPVSLPAIILLSQPAQIPVLFDKRISPIGRKQIGRSGSMGLINFGDLRRLTPVSKEFGFERGLPIDRYYIEKFLAEHTSDIQGRVFRDRR